MCGTNALRKPAFGTYRELFPPSSVPSDLIPQSHHFQKVVELGALSLITHSFVTYLKFLQNSRLIRTFTYQCITEPHSLREETSLHILDVRRDLTLT